MLTKEYRICMPLTVEEYKIGQLYMIARHSLEQSDTGNGVEVIENKECLDPVHGKGQFTEKRIHLSRFSLLHSRLPYWIQAFCPRVFYIIERGWNYYPFTITEYTCSFIPKLHITILTKFENNAGTSENCLNLPQEKLEERTVDFVDIAFDELNTKHYKKEEDPKFFKSTLTGRGPLVEGWRQTDEPIMCSYKLVQVSFEVWGLQTKVEGFIHNDMKRSVQDLWRRWPRDYLSQLQQRSKWKQATKDVCVGQLVLLKQDNTPPHQWPLKRIVDTTVGHDGHVRVVVKTATGCYKRAVTEISVLPVDPDEDTVEKQSTSSTSGLTAEGLAS
ncbi:cytoplasmic phosphatidylinositol transfer protein 1 [Topomyia yanbarensis]|uniref:cytoplasmic phosphatidylinositol transfer protein 1 n=1 Tax=Topomyia yanbarensis TaxID=2498891 RepID=UPI00273BB8FF|nr:cytoplasmic phosphatidylinositol transfer protein 1 [Topomyia yanbarensis]